MSANGDMRVGKQAEPWHTHCVFVLSLCGFYLSLAHRKRVPVETIRFDCTNRGGGPALVWQLLSYLSQVKAKFEKCLVTHLEHCTLQMQEERCDD